MRKKLYVLTILVFLMLCLILLSGCSNEEEQKNLVDWPYEQEYIPVGGFTDSVEENNKKVFYKKDMTQEEFSTYIDNLRAQGFELNILESEFDSFEQLSTASGSSNYVGKIVVCLVKGFASDKDYKKLNINWYDKQLYLDKTGVTVENALDITIK